MSPFYRWLEEQAVRTDVVGRYANHALRSNTYPRLSSKLSTLLKHEPPHLRSALKTTHREWRQVRDAK